MKKYFLSLAAIALLSTSAVKAQKDSTKVKKEIKIEKRLENGKPEKTIIVIDGNKVTVNGEEVEGLKDLRGKLQGMNGNFNFDMEALGPQMREMFRNFNPGGMQELQNHLQDLKNTRSNKAMLGVNVQKDDKGAKITEVVKESGAEKAGLKTDDIITAINADKIADGDALIKTIGKYKPEDVVDITVLRSGKEKKFKATLGKNDVATNNTFNWNSDDFGLPNTPGAGPRMFNFNHDELRGFNNLPADRPKFGLDIKDNEDGDGVVVTEVKDDTNASKAGLKESDIITEAAGTTIKNVDDLKRVLAENRDKSEISIKVLRSGKTQNLTLKVPKKIKTAEL